MFIWQQSNWPNFEYKIEELDDLLNEIVKLQNRISKQVISLHSQDLYDIQKKSLVNNVFLSTHSKDEGVDLLSIEDCVSVYLLKEKATHTALSIENPLLIQMFSKVMDDLHLPITQSKLYQWHATLFAQSTDQNIGELRRQSTHEMSHKTLKYIAPPKEELTNQIQKFKFWFNEPFENDKQNIVRAGIAHFWFITLHPFEDGNGRIARALTDRALAQAKPENAHLYSMTPAIDANKTKYQSLLIQTQRCQMKNQQSNPMDITQWLEWFLHNLYEEMLKVLPFIEYKNAQDSFWLSHSQTVLTQRQVDVLNKIAKNADLFVDGINAGGYQELTGVSKATATRDLTGLQKKGCLKKMSRGGRSTRYRLKY
ncbi:Fic family protein [Marinicellulosiphila megalodicopiae]|uniref:Fic family protein n=1 Tax=Marinicellulosiphila megalodicopiae TaxID=2724896 RepID=UPI003BB1AC5F